jgi:hypothetical protein
MGSLDVRLRPLGYIQRYKNSDSRLQIILLPLFFVLCCNMVFVVTVISEDVVRMKMSTEKRSKKEQR